jgi:hypothetical protein
MSRPGRSFSPDPPPRLRPLKKTLARRRRACRHLGLAVPREIAHGPADTLALRVATLDRWIGRELDRAGGVRLPLPGGPLDVPLDDELDEDVDDGPDDRDDPDDEVDARRPPRARSRGRS